jgi:hypothetical protein
LLNDQNLVVGLGFPLKQRSDAITTYVTSQVKRKLQIRPPIASNVPYKPEPVLSNDDYDHILKILTDMTFVMERTPKAFTSLNEEAIRTFFLVLLNGHYEGKATAETFNCSGKTDILIRENGKNLFIAECKFWRGPKQFKDTIDQLLGYTSWRDTKTAILLFNKKKDFSKVLDAIPQTVEEHPNYKSKGKTDETIFRYVFGHMGDQNRELLLTVMAFDIPNAPS